MKIVIVVEQFDLKAKYLEYYLAGELTKHGHKVYVLTFSGGKNFSRRRITEGFEIVTVPYFVLVHCYHLPNLSGIACLFNFLKAEKPDIIHCQPLGSPLSLFFTAWKHFFNYKIVGSIQTQLNSVFSPWGLKKKLLFSLSKIVLSRYITKSSEIIFAKNRELAKLLSRSYDVPIDKFSIVPLGSDPDLYKFDPEARVKLRKKLRFSETDVVLMYSGKIDSTKGLDVLIRALAPIATKNDKVKLLIIGKGDLSFMKYLKGYISSFKIDHNVLFHPWVNSATLPFFYSASDIGVWPGLSSISIVDAASTGLPLIIARCPVEIFAIENGNGFAFEIGNAEELRSYIETLVYDERLRKLMGHKSRLLVEHKLNWTKIAHSYLNAYSLAEDIPKAK
jgi:glycosyltransferase involved in cell wall biosynthesis